MADNLTDFLAQSAKPFDPETDDYRRASFAEPVKSGKNSAIYNAHSYHTKVPPEGIVPYIKHYTDPSDLVLDPFCGSGMTGVASQITGRNVILNDLSPAAIHIARNFTSPVDVKSFKATYEKIRSELQNDFDDLYSTTCDRCGKKATIVFTVWSDVYECERCEENITLWEVAVNLEEGQVQELFQCPKCNKEWRKGQLKRKQSIPVFTDYECKHCKPSRGQHKITEEEIKLIERINSKEIKLWYPKDSINTNWEMYIRGALHRRDIHTVDQFFTKRNLIAASLFWDKFNKVSDDRIRDALRFLFTSVLVTSTIMTRYNLGKRGNGPMSGLLYIPSLSVENNITITIARKSVDILKTYTKLQIDRRGAFWIVGSATNLPLELNDSIDYIFTDPPFGQNLYYADLNFIWESWLGLFTNREKEAVVHREQVVDSNTIADYERLMTEAFKEMYRVLKPGRWASIVFHNSDDKIWQTILNAAELAGLEVAEVNAFDKVQLSYKGIKGLKGEERVTNKDIVLNLRKPRQKESAHTTERADQAEAEQRVLETVANFLATNPQHSERSLQHIWNHVLFDMIRSGNVQVSMAMLDEMLSYHYKTFKIADGKYYLRGEAVVGGNVFDLNTDAGAIAWLNSVLSNEPQNTGQLIPKWQKETAHLNVNNPGRLDILLEQNFWQEEKSGNWRIPTNAEREKMSAREDLGAQAHLRVIHRFLQGTFDHHPSDLELAAWIRFCYSREFYPEAFALFEYVNEAGLESEEYKTIKKMSSAARMKT